LAESTGSKFFEIVIWRFQARHVIPVADMSSICITTLRRRSQLIDRRRLCTRGWRAADGKANDCNNCSLPFPFRTKAPLRGGACTSLRSTCERARRELGNPVNSLCMVIRVQCERSRDGNVCRTNSESNFREVIEKKKCNVSILQCIFKTLLSLRFFVELNRDNVNVFK